MFVIGVCLYVGSVRFYDLGASLSGTSAHLKIFCMPAKMNVLLLLFSTFTFIDESLNSSDIY